MPHEHPRLSGHSGIALASGFLLEVRHPVDILGEILDWLARRINKRQSIMRNLRTIDLITDDLDGDSCVRDVGIWCEPNHGVSWQFWKVGNLDRDSAAINRYLAWVVYNVMVASPYLDVILDGFKARVDGFALHNLRQNIIIQQHRSVFTSRDILIVEHAIDVKIHLILW